MDYSSASGSYSEEESDPEQEQTDSESSSNDDVNTDDDQSFEIGKIIGINQPTFTETSTPLMFYVKFEDKSYRCCEWLTKNEICKSNRGLFLYRLFKSKPTPFEQVPNFNTSELFSSNDEYQLYTPTNFQFDEGLVTPQKVISMREKSDTNEYLVKWTSLDIIDSTWETEVPIELIEEFKQSYTKTHPICYRHQNNQKLQKFQSFTESPEFKNGNRLSDYQVEGLNWLLMCWLQKKNSILADEMGLGKTIESISIIECLSKWYRSWGPFLIVCPLSTVTNWLNELKKWTDFRVVSLMGSKESRQFIKENLIYTKKNKKHIIFDVLLVSYESLSLELRFITRFDFMYTIIDEAQRLKNAETITYQNCSAIRSHHFLLMTGTPIQNSLFEIWSLLHFISPSEFDDFEEFELTYIDKENPETIEKLQEVLRPFIFRRKKNDVDLELPEKEEIIIEVEMTQIQRTFSQLFYKDNLGVLMDNSTNKVNMNNLMLQLRKLYCHPFLFPHLESICLSQYRDTHHIPYPTPLTIDDEMNSLILASGKTILIDKLIPKLKEGNHKILIFSQFTSVLDILEDYLNYRHYPYERLDGSCNTSKRSRSIEKFQTDEEVFIFLLSTRAGGLGINLTKADTVIIYDSDWNPQNDIQAQARCHRIGQTKKVNVYRLITRGSYESEMFLRASKKLALDYAILDSASKGKRNENKDSSLDKKELEMILKKGAYYTFKDDSNEIDKFCSENIDQILEHRSHTRKDVVSGGNSKFSKVSFEAQTEDENEFLNKLIEDENNAGDESKNDNSKMRTRPKKKIDYADIKHSNKEKKNKPKQPSQFLSGPYHLNSSQSLSQLNNMNSTSQAAFYSSSPQSSYLMTSSSSLSSTPLMLSPSSSFSQLNSPVPNSPLPLMTKTTLNRSIIHVSPSTKLPPKAASKQSNPNKSTPKRANTKIKQLLDQKGLAESIYTKLTNQSNFSTTLLSFGKTQINQMTTLATKAASNQSNPITSQTSNESNAKSPKSKSIQSYSNASPLTDHTAANNEPFSLLTKFLCDSLSLYNPSNGEFSESFSDVDFDSFQDSIDLSLYEKAISTLKKHGICSSRFFVSEFVQELCKSLVVMAYIRLPKQTKRQFSGYVHQLIPDFSEQIQKTPFKEFSDVKFMSLLFKGEELDIIKQSSGWDSFYKVALFISTEKLPENFRFAPEMSSVSGWTPVEDFVAVTSLIFTEDHASFINDSKLPFKPMIQKVTSFKKWIFDRIRLIASEVSQIIPKDFSIYEPASNEDDSSLIFKQIGDIQMFSSLNRHLFYSKSLSVQVQKKLLRICYLYGIPEKDTVKKIKFILRDESIDDELICIFIIKLLLRLIKYKPNLLNLLKSIQKVNYENSILNGNSIVDIRWINQEAISAAASNVDLINTVRENFLWFSKNQKKIELSILKVPNEIQNYCKWWNFKCDIVLFNITTYYGFLFNSMICNFIRTPNITESDISNWREFEILNLTPFKFHKASFIESVFSIEMKKARIIQILELIKEQRENEKNV